MPGSGIMGVLHEAKKEGVLTAPGDYTSKLVSVVLERWSWQAIPRNPDGSLIGRMLRAICTAIIVILIKWLRRVVTNVLRVTLLVTRVILSCCLKISLMMANLP